MLSFRDNCNCNESCDQIKKKNFNQINHFKNPFLHTRIRVCRKDVLLTLMMPIKDVTLRKKNVCFSFD
jgi:hypothetical protein